MAAKINYGKLMHQAMRGLIRKVLARVAEEGLPGEHHFFITFSTTHPEVEIADWLRERYPSEITIVMQNWFDDLEVGADGFSVTLNFGSSPENMYIPYDSLETFVDPSVEFGLRFEHDEEDDATNAEVDVDVPLAPMAVDVVEEEKTPGEVVSLDQFRKN